MPESQLKVEYNYHCGDDLAVVNAARRSFGAKSEWNFQSLDGSVFNSIEEAQSYFDLDDDRVEDWVKRSLKDKDVNLLRFLARGMSTNDFDKFCDYIPAPDTEEHRAELIEMLWKWRNTPTHDTPFNHCFISFDVAAPIFVARQLVKHEYLIMSEFSRRYKTEDIEFYEPDYWRKASPDKKQGSLEEEIDQSDFNPNHLNGKLKHLYLIAVEDYGVAPEQARMVLPQSLMTSWTWSGTLGAFAKMCRERLDPHAQYETRLVAQQVYDYLKQHYPVSAPLLVEGIK